MIDPEFPTGGTARERIGADLVTPIRIFQSRQYSLDERRVLIIL